MNCERSGERVTIRDFDIAPLPRSIISTVETFLRNIAYRYKFDMTNSGNCLQSVELP
jgi:hypothetical protein